MHTWELDTHILSTKFDDILPVHLCMFHTQRSKCKTFKTPSSLLSVTWKHSTVQQVYITYSILPHHMRCFPNTLPLNMTRQGCFIGSFCHNAQCSLYIPGCSCNWAKVVEDILNIIPLLYQTCCQAHHSPKGYNRTLGDLLWSTTFKAHQHKM